ncbi:hypothetical protein VNO77_22146 [Canavalia gladiata]|uniref:Uncharacterized protein n=1 Tax=Canavalia gladiata TaxID=3824 RepID=A0AAN9L322_CANGL
MCLTLTSSLVEELTTAYPMNSNICSDLDIRRDMNSCRIAFSIGDQSYSLPLLERIVHIWCSCFLPFRIHFRVLAFGVWRLVEFERDLVTLSIVPDSWIQ